MIRWNERAWPIPKSFCYLNSGMYATVDEDKGMLIYHGSFFTGPSLIVSSIPVPRQCGIFYMEGTVLINRLQGLICIGICEVNPDLNSTLGDLSGSIGYRSTGNVFKDSNVLSFAPSFQMNDTIGILIDWSKNTLSFTLNGRMVSTVSIFKKEFDDLYIAFSFQYHHSEVITHFGNVGSFKFDLPSYIRKSKQSLDLQIEISDEGKAHGYCILLIKEYLKQRGHIETLTSLEAEDDRDYGKFIFCNPEITRMIEAKNWKRVRILLKYRHQGIFEANPKILTLLKNYMKCTRDKLEKKLESILDKTLDVEGVEIISPLEVLLGHLMSIKISAQEAGDARMVLLESLTSSLII